MKTMISPDLEDCRWAVADFTSALPRARESMRSRIAHLLDGAIAEREKAAGRLRTQWAWLNANRSHTQFAEGEEIALASLERYERWCDVVHEMCAALGDTRDRCAG